MDTRTGRSEFETTGQCSMCGTCMAHCPSYRHFREETASPRGRLALCDALARGSVALAPVRSLAVDRCLRCLRCVSVCPSGVRVDRFLLEAANRAYSGGLTGLVKAAVLRGLLPYRRVVHGAVNAFSRVQAALGLHGRLVRHLPLFPFRGSLPRLARVSASRLLSARRPTAKKKAVTVALFLGCLVNFVYPDIAVHAVAALERNGMRVIIPREQTCCGTPAWVVGDLGAACRLARINVTALQAENPTAILVLCASCGRMMKETYPELLAGEDTRPFAAKIDDAAHFLSACSNDVTLPVFKTGETVAYHRPCHSRWYNLEEAIVALGRRARTDILVLPDSCCGGAGTFSLRFPEQGRAVAAATLRAIKQHAVTRVLTSCPGCIMQLREVTAQANIRVIVEHPVGVLG